MDPCHALELRSPPGEERARIRARRRRRRRGAGVLQGDDFHGPGLRRHGVHLVGKIGRAGGCVRYLHEHRRRI